LLQSGRLLKSIYENEGNWESQFFFLEVKHMPFFGAGIFFLDFFFGIANVLVDNVAPADFDYYEELYLNYIEVHNILRKLRIRLISFLG
jgi:hypothetical protein